MDCTSVRETNRCQVKSILYFWSNRVLEVQLSRLFQQALLTFPQTLRYQHLVAMLGFRGFITVLLFAFFQSSSALQKPLLNNGFRKILQRQQPKPDFASKNLKDPETTSSSRKGSILSRNVGSALPIENDDKRPRLQGRALFASAGVLVLGSLVLLLDTFVDASLPLESLKILLRNTLQNYKNSMIQRPLITKVTTGASLAVLGDALAQTRESEGYSPRRAFSFAVFDSCYRMFQHFAFPAIVGVCRGRFIGSILSAMPFVTVGTNLVLFLAALERTLMYQLGVIPLFYYPVFFTFTGFLQGLSLKGTWQRAKANFLSCWSTNLKFWIPIQLIMFGLIDENWQIPFVCVMGLIWATILSVIAGRANEETKPGK